MGGGGVMRTAAKFAVAGIRGVPLPQPEASWDVDDWEVPDAGEVAVEAGETVPTVVFGGVPSFQEAKVATTELKHALDKIYLSSNSAKCNGSSHSESENKSLVSEAITNPSPPNRALQAFQLLSESSEAQSVVASIACDPNIWNAIVQNPALQDFFQSQHSGGSLDQKVGMGMGVGELSLSDSLNILHNVKLTVAEMVASVSNYFHNVFGFLTGHKSSASGNTKANFMDPFTMGGTFMGLAVLVVMVIVLKRA
ncbi:uncharacterized protein LOC113856400 [Abrus precatorius]|uniref:Uncharacterized protein LOC113856400 n=1 Tax=Abrus precatorius TaxID=3816 RepID=A0A8B8KL30_ABRPR|nr:uncharacterized protein LOC113856400 [Abrus precatorius]